MGQSREAAIVGIYEYPLRKVEPGTTAMHIKMDSATRALEDAEVKRAAVWRLK